MDGLSSINRMTLRERVLYRIREGILSGELPPGYKLSEVDLAESLGVSRGTIREALRHLQQAGLAEGAERNSLYVRSLTTEEIHDLYAFRAILEAEAAVLMLHLPDAEYNQIVDRMESMLNERPDFEPVMEQFKRDLAFHQVLVDSCGNVILARAWRRVEDLTWITVNAGTQYHTEGTFTCETHRPLVDALRAKDPDTVRQVFTTHMQIGANYWLSDDDKREVNAG